MINEANDHPRYAVDVQRDQSKPGHPHSTVETHNYTPSAKKKQARRGKKAEARCGKKQSPARKKAEPGAGKKQKPGAGKKQKPRCGKKAEVPLFRGSAVPPPVVAYVFAADRETAGAWGQNFDRTVSRKFLAASSLPL